MTALRANTILRALDRHEQSVHMSALYDLSTAAQAEVRRTLSQVRPSSRIDIQVLVASVRERASVPSRALVEASILARLAGIAQRLTEAGQTEDGSEASKLAMSLFAPKRRSIPRVASRRARTPDSPPDRALDAPAPINAGPSLLLRPPSSLPSGREGDGGTSTASGPSARRSPARSPRWV